jgi:hypothetical protein
MTETTKRARAIDDAGEKIAGARKDWRERFMDAADLNAMTNAEAIELVKKDNVWPQPDWEKAVADGMPAEVAAYVKIMRDRVAKVPRFTRSGQNATTVRANYVEMLTIARDVMMAGRSVDDVRDFYRNILTAAGADGLNASDESRQKFFSVYQTRKCPFGVSHADGQKVREMLSEGFPAKIPVWRKGVRAYPSRGGTEGPGAFMLIKNNQKIHDGYFPTEEAAWKWLAAENAKPAAKAKKPKGPVVPPEKPHLDNLERHGFPDRRNGRDVTPEDFISTFKFRGVQFGDWLPDNERQKVLNLAYDALFDFAELMEVDHSTLSLDGTLSVAFGARGQGYGRAHYESGQKVFNFTRLNGAGTVAHEWAHAVDNWAGEADVLGNTQRLLSGTGWYDRIKGIKRMLANLTDDQAEAWENMVEDLFTSPLTKEEALEKTTSNLNVYAENVRNHSEQLTSHLARAVERQNKTYIKKMREYLADQSRRQRLCQERIDKINEGGEGFSFGKRQSAYYEEAQKLCGKSGEYWTRPTEMFARAFEVYIFDKMQELGVRSDYLVHGVEADRYSNKELFKGNPYAGGIERDRINGRIEDLVTAMKPRIERDLDSTPAPR